MSTLDSGPLAGSLVVDLSRALAGPHATMMLGDLGARVIKIEAPGRGDDTRGWGPPFVAPVPDQPGFSTSGPGTAGAESTYFLSANRNKESIALDLKNGDDLQVLLDLVARAEDEGWPTSKACQTLGLQERRLRRWRRRAGTDAGLVDARPGASVNALTPVEIEAPTRTPTDSSASTCQGTAARVGDTESVVL